MLRIHYPLFSGLSLATDRKKRERKRRENRKTKERKKGRKKTSGKRKLDNVFCLVGYIFSLSLSGGSIAAWLSLKRARRYSQSVAVVSASCMQPRGGCGGSGGCGCLPARLSAQLNCSVLCSSPSPTSSSSCSAVAFYFFYYIWLRLEVLYNVWSAVDVVGIAAPSCPLGQNQDFLRSVLCVVVLIRIFPPDTSFFSFLLFLLSLSLYLSSHKTTFVLLFLFQAPFPSSVALLLLLCTTTTPYEKAAKKQSWLPKNFFPLLLLLLLSLSPLLLLLHRAAFGMGVRTHVHSAALTAAASITRILL